MKFRSEEEEYKTYVLLSVTLFLGLCYFFFFYDSGNKEYYPNGKYRIIYFGSKEKGSGPVKVYYPNGKVYHSCYLSNGKEIGMSRSWHPNGKLQFEGTALPNKHDLYEVRKWYPNGQMAFFRKDYDNGYENYNMRGSWYSNGQLFYVVSFREGYPKDSITIYYNKDGTVLRKQFYDVYWALRNGKLEIVGR